MRMHYTKASNLSQLHDEILASCSAVRPIDGQAQMIVEGDPDNVWLTLPDDLSLETQQQIEAVVTNHKPTTKLEPNWAAFRSQVSMHSAYLRLVTEHPQNAVLNDLLVPLLWNVGHEPGTLTEVAQVWNAMQDNVSLIETEIAQLNIIAEACRIPLRVDEQGRMTAG